MTLVLLQPTWLPTSERDLLVAADAPAPLRLARRLAMAAPGVAGGAGTDVLERLRALPAPPVRPEQGPEPSCPVPYTYDDRLREYDAFFDVVRSGSAADGVFPRSLLVAYRSLLEEGLVAGTRLSWTDWSSLCAALQAMICRCAGMPGGRLPASARPPLLRWHLDPDRRWRVGHHVFFVLTQSIIVSLQAFRTALSESDTAAAARSLRLATRMLAASGVAFVFTAEFSAAQYEDRVRPSMTPPYVRAGFSGLLSPDHHYLVKLFAELRPVLRDLPGPLVADHRAFARTLGTVFEAHKYVCTRFGGDVGTSLRTGEGSGLPAVSVLHALKLARTKIVGSR